MPILKPIRGTQLNLTHPLSRGLVGCYMADGGKNAFDYSRNGNNGTFGDGADASTFPTLVPGNKGYAWSFDGGDYIELNDTFSAVSLSNVKTFSLWLSSNKTDYSTRGRAISISRTSKNTAYLIGAYGNPATWEGVYSRSGDVFTELDSGVTVVIGEWTHICLVQNNNNIALYINSQLKASASNAVNPTVSSPVNTFIAAYNENGTAGQFFNGLIDDVKVYDRALMADEVRLLYQEPFCMFENDSKISKKFL